MKRLELPDERIPGGLAQFTGRAAVLGMARNNAISNARRVLRLEIAEWTIVDEQISFYEGNGREQADEVVCSIVYARGTALDRAVYETRIAEVALRQESEEDQATIARANAE